MERIKQEKQAKIKAIINSIEDKIPTIAHCLEVNKRNLFFELCREIKFGLLTQGERIIRPNSNDNIGAIKSPTAAG